MTTSSTEQHVHECPSEPNKGIRIAHMPRSDGFGGTIPGVIWCWRHVAWEPIPQDWQDRERELRTSILPEFEAWQDKQYANTRTLLAFPDSLVELVSAYTTHRSLRLDGPLHALQAHRRPERGSRRMTALDDFPLPATAEHDEHGNHIPPHIPEWRRAADPTGYGYDPNRVARGSEIARDQRQKAALAAHLEEHRRLGQPAHVLDGS